jgi:two-component system, OmpR family, phosphate regulon sensor histidine kinase PhoR
MRGGFRTRIFLAIVSVAAAVLLCGAAITATALRRQTYERIERGLVADAKLAAELLSHRTAVSSPGELRTEAHALARDISARVTLIAADGVVAGDSSQDEAGLATLENHGGRPEVVEARTRGIGVSTRSSSTLGTDMLYVAVPVQHPSIAFVRLALPLTDIERQLGAIWRSAVYALLFSVVAAAAMAWGSSTLLARRLDRLADGVRRYASGEIAAPPTDYEDDEIGTVARALNEAVQRLGERASDLARDRARMEAILAGMVEGVLVVDSGDRVQLVNQAARDMLRLDASALGRHYLECIRHPAVVAQLAAVRNQSGRIEPAVFAEGSRVSVARAAPVADAHGRAAVLVLHDITDLQRADQIRRDFVANVSHELRTPLTAIRGYVEALGDSPNPDEAGRFLEIIARHTARMERLVNDLLRLARLEAGQELPDYSSCHIESLIAAVVADLQPAIDVRRQRVDIQVEPAVATIVGDPTQLHDALRNLIENATIYSREGGGILIEARRQGDRFVLTVADEGPGIPPADVSRVFERFYRVDKARSRDSGGTGLGLAIVKHLVERMDGSVEAANRDRGGAIFTIRLPLTPTAQPIAS